MPISRYENTGTYGFACGGPGCVRTVYAPGTIAMECLDYIEHRGWSIRLKAAFKRSSSALSAFEVFCSQRCDLAGEALERLQ